MKKQIANLSQAVKIKAVLFLFLFLSVSSMPSWAFKQDSSRSNSPAIVKYIGSVEDQVLFQLSYDNKEGAVFYIMVKDDQGNILYNGKFNDAKFSKQFRFYKSDLSNSGVSFILTSQNEKQNQVFHISTTSRVIEDVVVTKL